MLLWNFGVRNNSFKIFHDNFRHFILGRYYFQLFSTDVQVKAQSKMWLETVIVFHSEGTHIIHRLDLHL